MTVRQVPCVDQVRHVCPYGDALGSPFFAQTHCFEGLDLICQKIDNDIGSGLSEPKRGRPADAARAEPGPGFGGGMLPPSPPPPQAASASATAAGTAFLVVMGTFLASGIYADRSHGTKFLRG